jgi:hypothetical protein
LTFWFVARMDKIRLPICRARRNIFVDYSYVLFGVCDQVLDVGRVENKKIKKTNAPGCRTPPHDQVFFISFTYCVPSVLPEIDTSSPCGFSFSSTCQSRLHPGHHLHLSMCPSTEKGKRERRRRRDDLRSCHHCCNTLSSCTMHHV